MKNDNRIVELKNIKFYLESMYHLSSLTDDQKLKTIKAINAVDELKETLEK